MFRAIRLFFGYIGLMIGGVIWFICFPLTAYTLYATRQFPFGYFGIPFPLSVPLDFFLPPDIQPAVGGICLGFTLYGLFTIYFNVRKLRRIRLREI